MSSMIESLEGRTLMSVAAVSPVDADAVQAHVEEVIAARADLTAQRQALREMVANDRQAIVDLAAAARVQLKADAQAIRAARGDAELVAAARQTLAADQLQFRTDIAAAKAQLKSDLTTLRSAVVDATAAFRDAAATLTIDARQLNASIATSTAEERSGIRDLIDGLKAIAKNGGVTQSDVQKVVDDIQARLGPPSDAGEPTLPELPILPDGMPVNT
jgi:hypothetical protein